MEAAVGHLLAGLGGGAAVAALALGLVLSYRSSGVVNFAHAAAGLYSAAAFFELRQSGDLVLPVLGLPARLHVVDRPTVLTAGLVVAVLTAAMSAAVYALLIRPLRDRSALSKVAATLGLLLYLQEVVRLRFPPSSAGAQVRTPILPDDPIRVAGSSISQNRVLLAALVIGAAVVLHLIDRRTRFGLASRAAADDERGALLVGLAPAWLAAAGWALAGVLGGAAVVLVEPISGLGPTTSLLVVPALAAALPGRLRSFGAAVVGGLLIGMVQSLILGTAVGPLGASIPDWVPTTGLQEAIPTLVIVGLLLWRGDLIAGRGAVGAPDARPPRAPRHLARWSILSLVLGAVALASFDAALRQALVVSMVFALLCLSIVVVTGYSGQISLAQLTLAGIGGFTALRLGAAGVPFALAAPLAVLVATLVGVAIAVPMARLRGPTVAVATLAVAVALERLVLQSSALSGGSAGLDASRPSLFGIDLGFSASGAGNARPAFGAMVLVALVASGSVVALLRRSPTGLHWLAVRADERAAAAAGIGVRRAKVGAFALAAAVAGSSGVFTAHSVPTVSVQSFMVVGSIVAVALTALAGPGRIGGAVLAGVFAQAGLLTTVLDRWSAAPAREYAIAVSGLALMVTAVTAPAGLLDAWADGVRRVRAAAGGRPPATAPVVNGLEHAWPDQRS